MNKSFLPTRNDDIKKSRLKLSLDIQMAPHHSFKEFYETQDSGKLPFNQDPPRLIGEKSDFISLPIKRNAKMFGAAKKEFKLKDIYRDPRKTLPDNEGSYLSFEKALLRHMNSMNEESNAKISNLITLSKHEAEGEDYYMEMASLRPNQKLLNSKEEDLILSHFPTPNQWRALDQLRVHAGRPERSKNGISMLVE